MEIIFVRHGQKEPMGENPYLTKTGVKQAKHLAKRLKKIKIDDFFCSNMNRAKQTALIVSKKVKIKPKIESSLNEFESKTITEKKNRWSKEEKKHYHKLIKFLDKITKNPDGQKTVLIIAHGFTNRIILSYFTGLELRNLIGFYQKETSINIIHKRDEYKNWGLKKWNDNHHVPKRLRR